MSSNYDLLTIQVSIHALVRVRQRNAITINNYTRFQSTHS